MNEVSPNCPLQEIGRKIKTSYLTLRAYLLSADRKGAKIMKRNEIWWLLGNTRNEALPLNGLRTTGTARSGEAAGEKGAVVGMSLPVNCWPPELAGCVREICQTSNKILQIMSIFLVNWRAPRTGAFLKKWLTVSP